MTIDKTLNDILNHFAEYAKYDPDQKRFNLLSDNYKFHQAGKVMEMLISEYDPSGVLAVMYAKREFLNSLKKRVDLGSLIFAMAGDEPKYMDELQRILSMYRDFNSDAYKQAVTGYIDDMNTLIQQVSKMKLIGDRNSGMEEDEFISTIMQVSDDLKKLRLICTRHPEDRLQRSRSLLLVYWYLNGWQMPFCIWSRCRMPFISAISGSRTRQMDILLLSSKATGTSFP